MKKIIFILIAIMCLANTYAQSFIDRNKNISIGAHFGAVGQNEDMGLQIIMLNVTVYGVYIDFGGWPQSHGSDINVGIWEADKAELFHIGYQLPVTNWLKITPLIGYANDETGYTNGYNYKIDQYGIHNQFISETGISDFDFGGQAKFEIPINKKTSIDIMGTYTKYSWYGGIGVTIDFN